MVVSDVTGMHQQHMVDDMMTSSATGTFRFSCCNNYLSLPHFSNSVRVGEWYACLSSCIRDDRFEKTHIETGETSLGAVVVILL
jgi:hypothetical protein